MEDLSKIPFKKDVQLKELQREIKRLMHSKFKIISIVPAKKILFTITYSIG